MGHKIVVLIPHYGELHYLEACLASVKDLLDKPDEILIFDNTDSDVKIDTLTKFRLYGGGGNVGFTKAINLLMLESDATFYWVLNNDALVHPECLGSLLKTMNKYPKCGIVSSYIYDATHKDRICFTGGGDVLQGMHRIDVSDKPRRERWVTFCSVLIRAEMVEQIGRLDPNYFLVCSDSDYCYTARSRGWDILSDPKSIVYHHEEHGISRVHNIDPDMQLRKKMRGDQRYFIEKWIGSELFRDLNLEVFPGE